MNWEQIDNDAAPERKCAECNGLRCKDEFLKRQWDSGSSPCCTACLTAKRAAGTPYQCTHCSVWKEGNAFQPQVLGHFYKLCLECDRQNADQAKRKCPNSKRAKVRTYFSRSMWEAAADSSLCKNCEKKGQNETWQCHTSPRLCVARIARSHDDSTVPFLCPEEA